MLTSGFEPLNRVDKDATTALQLKEKSELLAVGIKCISYCSRGNFVDHHKHSGP